jgi:PPM family protein phosphatase
MVSYYGLTDIGRRRPLNEDAIHANDGLFVVCDGMGGHKAGEVASQLAIEVIGAFVRRSSADAEITWPYGLDPSLSFNSNRIRTAIQLANRAVCRKAASSDDYTGMGTTVVALVLSPNGRRMTFAHVGDSRMYLIRGGAILQLTHDDSWANLDWRAGSDNAETVSMKNVLTKALGAREDVDFDVREDDLSDGDVLLLCSDGLTNMVPDRRLLEIVLTHRADVEGACTELIASANAAGGRDNISAILVRYSS